MEMKSAVYQYQERPGYPKKHVPVDPLFHVADFDKIFAHGIKEHYQDKRYPKYPDRMPYQSPGKVLGMLLYPKGPHDSENNQEYQEQSPLGNE